MSDDVKPTNRELTCDHCGTSTGRVHYGPCLCRKCADGVDGLRAALEGLVKINAEDFPVGPDGRINWSAFPVTFGYAKAYRAALVALGRETA